MERKLARLKREIEEVKEEYGKRQAEQRDAVGGEVKDLEPDVMALSRMLDGISTSQGRNRTSTGRNSQKILGQG